VTHDEPVSRFRQIGMAAGRKDWSSGVVILLPTAVAAGLAARNALGCAMSDAAAIFRSIVALAR